jgi:hypothetical protein
MYRVYTSGSFCMVTVRRGAPMYVVLFILGSPWCFLVAFYLLLVSLVTGSESGEEAYQKVI